MIWTWNSKQWTFVVLTLLTLTGFIWVGDAYGWWQAGVLVLSVGIATTLFPESAAGLPPVTADVQQEMIIG